MVMEFNLTLQVAAELTADATLELVTAIKSISPADTEAWEKQIEGPVLALADGPVAVLSRGWSHTEMASTCTSALLAMLAMWQSWLF